MLHRFAGRRTIISGLMAALVVACLAPVHAGEESDMAAYMALATPGPHHEALSAKAGSYKTTSKMWMDPSQPPMETAGTAEIEAVLGGRFVQEVTKANMMGMPWEGRGIFGYDNATKKHTGTWFDSFGTMMMSFEGTCKDHCKQISLTANYLDPVTKTEKGMKTVTEDKGDGVAVTTLYDLVDGKEVKMGVITYERVSDQASRK